MSDENKKCADIGVHSSDWLVCVYLNGCLTTYELGTREEAMAYADCLSDENEEWTLVIRAPDGCIGFIDRGLSEETKLKVRELIAKQTNDEAERTAIAVTARLPEV